MKKLLTSFLAIGSVTLLILSSCTKNDVKTVNANPKSSALTVNTTAPVLDKTKLTDTTSVVMFNFTAPSYTYKAVVANSLEIDAAGDNWKSPTTAALGSSGSHGYSTAAFNALLLKLNLPAGKASQVNVRVVNALSSDVSSYSNVITLTVTPFNLVSFLYVVGAYDGWPSLPNSNAGVTDSLISPTSNGIYTGIINFTAGNNAFLILPAKSSYDNKYATSQSSTPTTTVTQNAGNNLLAPATAGYYFITFNVNTNVITFEQTNSYSVIGSSTPPLGNNYSTDIDMKYVNGNQDWEVSVGMVEAGGFKIRQNHDWMWSWGTLGTPDGVTLTDNGGGNINIATVGVYKVTFTYPVAPYSVTGTPPSVTATYTLTQ